MDNKISIPKSIPKRIIDNNDTKIPKIIIQTYKNNLIDKKIFNNTLNALSVNKDYDYLFIDDTEGMKLIKNNFNESVLSAFMKLKAGAAKGDFIRYITLYIYGGVYLDMDSSMGKLDVPKGIDFCLFYDDSPNIIQWCIAWTPGHKLLLKIINEMVDRIHNGEQNIFLATGPCLVNDVIYNFINKSNIYGVSDKISKERKTLFFNKNRRFQNGLLIHENNDLVSIKFKFDGYNNELLYSEDNPRYTPTYNGEPTPGLYN